MYREIMMGDRAFSGELQDGCSRVPPAYGTRLSVVRRGDGWVILYDYRIPNALLVHSYLFEEEEEEKKSLARESSFLEFVEVDWLYSILFLYVSVYTPRLYFNSIHSKIYTYGCRMTREWKKFVGCSSFFAILWIISNRNGVHYLPKEPTLDYKIYLLTGTRVFSKRGWRSLYGAFLSDLLTPN